MSEEEVEELIAIYKDKGRLQIAKRLGNMFQSYQKVVLENTQLKKSLENAQDIYKNSHKYTSECEDKVIVFQTQQKEFLNYLRELSNWYSADGVKQGMVNDILTKYKEIIDKGIGEDK